MSRRTERDAKEKDERRKTPPTAKPPRTAEETAGGKPTGPVEAKPTTLILDTNVLMRLLIIEFGIQGKLAFFPTVAALGARIVLAPTQTDECWRNLPAVFDEHVSKWREIQGRIKSSAEELLADLRSAGTLGLCDGSVSEAAKKLKTEVQGLPAPAHTWEEFAKFAEIQLKPLSNAADPDAIMKKADARVRLFNPPCREKKERPLGDCVIWETALSLADSEGSVVWLATTDTDFCFSSKRIAELHPFLAREVRRCRGDIVFFHEDRNLGHRPGSRFKILDGMLKFLPTKAAEPIQAAASQVWALSPGTPQGVVETALQDRLSFREREVWKLLSGFGDGYEYTPEEVGLIFKVPPAKVIEIAKYARENLERAIERVEEESS